ncbi:hypothetical protein SKAU_G00387380 [Synaphobranchus kaupii]|uniref:Zinc finger CCHC domain-containing protein n=1 Tax=Synaphobranchus kaupii TaxID=118154 RepID=A0A9Q1EAW2_SYNKA|nr:hypothetical protein SKAU_G00387380 [Synaphobranchus kaupii]
MEDHYKKVEETCRVKPEAPELVRWRVQSLWRLNYRVVTVHVFNPFVTVERVKAFLGKYVEVLPAHRDLIDDMGMRCGKRQLQVLLCPDPVGRYDLCGEVGHVFRQCPQKKGSSYAQAVAGGPAANDQEEGVPGRSQVGELLPAGDTPVVPLGPGKTGEGVKGTAEKEEGAPKRKAAPQAEASGEVEAAEILSSLSDSLPSGQGECLVVSQGEVTSVTSGMEQGSDYSSAAEEFPSGLPSKQSSKQSCKRRSPSEKENKGQIGGRGRVLSLYLTGGAAQGMRGAHGE